MTDIKAGTLHINIAGDTTDLEKSLNTAEKDLKGFDGKVSQSVQSLGEMKKEFRTLSKMSVVGQTPQQLEATTKRMAFLKDAIGDANNTIKSLSLDPFQKMAESVQVASTMMAGLAGVTSLMGGEEKKMQELMQKTVALIAIANAAQEAATYFEERSSGIWIKNKTVELAARLKEFLTINTVTAASTTENAVKSKGSIITKAITAAQWLWNAAVAANPIVLLIAGVAALGLGVGLLVARLSKNNAELDNAKAKVDELTFSMESLNKANKFQLDVMRANGESSISINKERIKQIEKELNDNDELIKNLKVVGSETRSIFFGLTKDAKAANAKIVELNGVLKTLSQEQAVIQAENQKAELDRLKTIEEKNKNLETNLLSGKSKSIAELNNKRIKDLASEENDEKTKKLIWQNYYNDLAKLDREYKDKENQPLERIATKKIVDISRVKGKEEEIKQLGILNRQGLLTEKEYFSKLKEITDRYSDDITVGKPINLKIPVDVTIDSANSTIDFNWLTDQVVDITREISSAVQGGLTDLATGMADTFGQIAVGGAGLDTLFNGLLSSVGGFMQSLGSALIAAGIGAITFKSLLATPGLAIAAGAALVALGGVVKSKLAAGPSGSGSTYSSGSSTGRRESMTANRELTGNGTLKVQVVGTLKATGKELAYVLSNEDKRKGL